MKFSTCFLCIQSVDTCNYEKRKKKLGGNLKEGASLCYKIRPPLLYYSSKKKSLSNFCKLLCYQKRCYNFVFIMNVFSILLCEGFPYN